MSLSTSLSLVQNPFHRWRSSVDACPDKPLNPSGYALFIRHGHGTHISDDSSPGFFNGSLDGPKQAVLTKKGIEQAEKAAALLNTLSVQPLHAVVSPLKRTVQTFEVFKDKGVRTLDVRIEPSVIEIQAGPHEGEPFNWDLANDMDNRVPTKWKGETITSVEKRVLHFVKSTLLPLLEEQNALIVSHQMIMDTLETFEKDTKCAVPCEVRVYSKSYLQSWVKKMEKLHFRLENPPGSKIQPQHVAGVGLIFSSLSSTPKHASINS